MVRWSLLLPLHLLFLGVVIGGKHRFGEYGKSKSCPRVKPQSPEYLHYLMQHCSTGAELQTAYSKPANMSSAVYPTILPFNMDTSRIGLSDDHAGFQPAQEQDIADKCINVPPCDKSARYRTLNGSCNNFNFPMWGVAGSAMVRLLPAHYEDGVNRVRKSQAGKDLPNVRLLRTTLLKNNEVPDELNMLNVMQWGQLVAHDTSHIVQQDSENGGLDCCRGRYHSLPSPCLPIQVSKDDAFYSKHKKTCLNFVRAMTTTNLGCKLSPHQQIASVTHFVDASVVYGSDEQTARSLRTFSKGKLKVQLTADNREFLPNLRNPAQDCDNLGKDNICYEAGDDRVNQNTGVTVLQIVLLREHNRLCEELHSLNPTWSDEMLYQEARRVVVAFVQKITYDEYLPIIVGREFMKKNKMEDGKGDDPSSVDDYDPFLNPSTLNSFAAAAYRSFHSMVPRAMQLIDSDQKTVKTLKIDEFFFRPTFIQEAGTLDNLLRGLAHQPAQAMDHFFSVAITDLLFKSTKPFGTDLESTDIQRGRDHGLPTYNDFRVACGLPRANQFSDLKDIMSPEVASLLSKLYDRVRDIDLYIGGLLESLVPGTLTGPTFQCIIGEQFRRWRNGDRFYYEFGEQAGSFSHEQLKELRKVTLAEIFCRNGDNITSLPSDVFHVTSKHRNPLVSCSSVVKMNLTPWKDQ